jgi:hypothetical protein
MVHLHYLRRAKWSKQFQVLAVMSYDWYIIPTCDRWPRVEQRLFGEAGTHLEICNALLRQILSRCSSNLSKQRTFGVVVSTNFSAQFPYYKQSRNSIPNPGNPDPTPIRVLILLAALKHPSDNPFRTKSEGRWPVAWLTGCACTKTRQGNPR